MLESLRPFCRMREKETALSHGKRETRKKFLSRLRLTALSLPSDVVRTATGDVKRSCLRLLAAACGTSRRAVEPAIVRRRE